MRSDRNRHAQVLAGRLSLFDWEMRSDRNHDVNLTAGTKSLFDWEMRSDRNHGMANWFAREVYSIGKCALTGTAMACWSFVAGVYSIGKCALTGTQA